MKQSALRVSRSSIFHLDTCQSSTLFLDLADRREVYGRVLQSEQDTATYSPADPECPYGETRDHSTLLYLRKDTALPYARYHKYYIYLTFSAPRMA